MGEWSKSIGERGEAVVGNFLDMIGWGNQQKNISIPCVHTRHIGDGGAARTTHGLDYLFSYRSPLCDDLCDNLVISVKYKANGYPTSAAKFREYYSNLTSAVECFSQSEEFSRQVLQFPGCDKIRNFGVLCWFNNIDPYAEIKSVVSNIDIPKASDRYAGLYLIDNKTASFLFEAISYVKQVAVGHETSFAYIETGKSINPSSRAFSGPILPIEYVNLGLLAMKVTDKGGSSTLYLSTAAPFKEENLGRLIGFSQSISQNWASKFMILFPDYNNLTHSNSVGRILNAFSDRSLADKVEIGSYELTLLNG